MHRPLEAGACASGCAGSTSRRSPYLYVAPFFLVFGAFGLFPLGYTAWVSLTDRNLLDPVSHFIGLQNYTDAAARLVLLERRLRTRSRSG